LGYPTAVALAGDGPDRASLEQLAGELRIAPHVRFVGRLHGSEVPEFLAGIDVGYSGQRVLQIGRMYHSPLKLYEYLAMGKPVIASDFDDSRTTTRADTTGFLFPAGDVASLTQAIVRVHGARGRLAEIADVARADIVKEHSWVARVNAVIAALAE
jgi:glycosyltransferase involved in cell wall biosynthesis